LDFQKSTRFPVQFFRTITQTLPIMATSLNTELGLFGQEILTSSSEELHANRLALRDTEAGFPTRAETSGLVTLQSLNVSDLNGLFGKMSPVSFPQTEGRTLVPLSGRWGTWGMGGLTECWTLNGSEHTGTVAPSRSEGDVCSLSDVLETQQVLQRYYLSKRASAGILRRAERRGKSLPPQLKEALEQVANKA
jgi:hypothetical protein